MIFSDGLKQAFYLQRPILGQRHRVRSLRRRPNRCRKIGIVVETRHHMPMQVRHNVAETGQIDFGRCKYATHGRFHTVDHVHQFVTLMRRQVGHFGNVLLPDNAAKCRRVGFVVHGNHAQGIGLQQNIFVRRFTNGARLVHYRILISAFTLKLRRMAERGYFNTSGRLKNRSDGLLT